MQAEVDRASTELAAGAQAWEQGNARLDALLQQQFAAQRQSEADAAETAQAQERLNSIARHAYTNPVPEAWTMLTSVDPHALTRSLETLHVLARIGATQQGAVDALTRQRTGSRARADRLERLRQQAQTDQARLDAQLTALQERSAAVLADLEVAQALLARLRAQQRAQAESAAAARAAARGQRFLLAGAAPTGTCSASADGSYANGFLPPEMLCPLATAPGQQLAAQAAAAFDRLSQQHRADLGTPLCVTDSYRSYPAQVAVFAAKPSLAATPGRSQHGWGLAVDLCGGAERFGSPESGWLTANAPAFGFVHPAWAEPGGSKPEPWHWEFSG